MDIGFAMLLAWMGLLIPAFVHAQSQQSGSFGPSSRVDSIPRTVLEGVIRDAASDDVFSVRMNLDAPVLLTVVRSAAMDLQIPRLLAFVDASSVFQNNEVRGRLPPVGTGTLYATPRAWQRELCQVAIVAGIQGRETQQVASPSSWLVRDVHVYGSAYAIRELQAGGILPPARLLGGVPQEQRHLEALAAAVTSELSQVIHAPDDISVPRDCRIFVDPSWPTRSPLYWPFALIVITMLFGFAWRIWRGRDLTG